LNNATYADSAKEIAFNRAWMQQAGISSARKFSVNGLIPPAITGLHNADAIKAWMANGIKNVVGDNTRAPLMNFVMHPDMCSEIKWLISITAKPVLANDLHSRCERIPRAEHYPPMGNHYLLQL
jgi:hypothetical protein